MFFSLKVKLSLAKALYRLGPLVFVAQYPLFHSGENWVREGVDGWLPAQRDLPAFADAYFGLQESLSALYQRPVDLVIPAAVHNPYFLRSIEQNRALLYAA